MKRLLATAALLLTTASTAAATEPIITVGWLRDTLTTPYEWNSLALGATRGSDYFITNCQTYSVGEMASWLKFTAEPEWKLEDALIRFWVSRGCMPRGSTRDAAWR